MSNELDEIRSLLLETVQIANSNAKAIQANSGAIADLRVLQQQTFEQIEGLARETLEELARMGGEADEDRALIQEMQSEVRGLQIENQHILERIEHHLSDGHGAA